MTKDRESIPSKVRFEIFKFDLFTCQYCGRKAPEHKIFVIDHLYPVALGGTNEIYNLVTACEECNIGKSSEILLDSTYFETRTERMKKNKFLVKEADLIEKGKKILFKDSEIPYVLRHMKKKFKLKKVLFPKDSILLATLLTERYGNSHKAGEAVDIIYEDFIKEDYHYVLTKFEIFMKAMEDAFYFDKKEYIFKRWDYRKRRDNWLENMP